MLALALEKKQQSHGGGIKVMKNMLMVSNIRNIKALSKIHLRFTRKTSMLLIVIIVWMMIIMI